MIKRRFLYALISAVIATVFIFYGCGLYSDKIDSGGNEPIFYSVTYVDGSSVLCVKQVEENTCADYIIPKDKKGYDFVCWRWNGVKYDFKTPVTGNLVLSALWSDTVYNVSFVADGVIVDTRTYTLNDPSVSEPDVPDKNGYAGSWETYKLTGGDITVNAVYTPIVYPVRFYDGETLLYETTYTVENTDISVPDIPNKIGTTGRWSEFTLTGGEVNVYVIYEYVKYTVTFIADGIIVGECVYDVNSPEITPPQVPVKDGYSGVWEEYELNYTNTTVNAVYTPNPIKTPETVFTDEQGLCYELIDGVYTVTGYTGNATCIEIPEQAFGVPVAIIGDNAFESNCTFSEIKLNDNITGIGDYAFYGCTGLQRIVLPDSVETLGVMAFGGCAGLKSVTVGASMKLISKHAFANCPSLTEVSFLAVGDWTVSDNSTSEGGTVVTIDNDVLALALLKKFSDKFLFKV